MAKDQLERRLRMENADARNSFCHEKEYTQTRRVAEKVCQEGVAIEHKILEWKLAEEKAQEGAQQAKAS